LDLLTIVVTENASGAKSADTEVKSESSIQAAITNLLGFEQDAVNAKMTLDPSALVNASTTNDFKGEGETNRTGSLKAKMSAMVVEVLPGGILRIEGEKIVSVNNEEEVMRISGLVRPRDVTSINEVDSSKIANLRIDYFGKGDVAEYQRAGWGARLIRNLWPF
jgi:flagellar L-ring protein precursor FlgH